MRIVDTYLLYSFIRRLSTPFREWEMYSAGLIDEHGNFIVDKQDRTEVQNNSYSYFDVLILNLKKMLAKIPGGSSRIATFAAALYMLKEGHTPTTEKKLLQLTENFESKLDFYLKESRILLEDEAAGGIPVNNMGDGKIADPKAPFSKNKNKLLKRKQMKA